MANKLAASYDGRLHEIESVPGLKSTVGVKYVPQQFIDVMRSCKVSFGFHWANVSWWRLFFD
jgi:hypothetical protein